MVTIRMPVVTRHDGMPQLALAAGAGALEQRMAWRARRSVPRSRASHAAWVGAGLPLPAFCGLLLLVALLSLVAFSLWAASPLPDASAGRGVAGLLPGSSADGGTPGARPEMAIVTPAGNGVTAGTLTLTATFNSVGVELLFTGDDDGDATATLEFRPSGASTWRSGLPLWRTASSAAPGRAFYGSALLLDPGTAYEVRVTVGDPDGVAGAASQTKTITTRAENIPPASALAPTHYVDAQGGSDANAGTSPSQAWRTVRKALAAAPDGAVVHVAPGFYAVSGQTRTTRITLVAQNPAVDDGATPINEGQRSVLTYGPGTADNDNTVVISGPSSAADVTYKGVWQQVALTGPNSGRSYTLWKWAGAPLSSAQELGYASSKAELPRRVPGIKVQSGWSDARMAEWLHENTGYNYGFFTGANAADIFLRLPPQAPSSNPNSLYITVGKGEGLVFNAAGIEPPANGANIRLSGFEVRSFRTGIRLNSAMRYAVIDHSLFIGATGGVEAWGSAPSAYGKGHVVERNRFQDFNLRAQPGQSPTGIVPWDFVKYTISDVWGSIYKPAGEYIVGSSETSAFGGQGGAREVVFRRNVVDGPFNGVSTWHNGNYDRYSMADLDVHDNLFKNIADDVWENEPNGINARIWNNRVEHSLVFVSIARSEWGPVYIWRNTTWQIGDQEVGITNDGKRGVAALAFKVHGGHTVVPKVYVAHNTFWSNQPGSKAWQITNGGVTNIPYWFLRNNIVRSAQRTTEWDTILGARWDEDYDHFAISNTGDAYAGHKYGGTVYRTVTDVAGYRAVSGGAQRTNRYAGQDRAFTDYAAVDGLLSGPTAGSLGLAAGSAFIDAGVPVPNISDRTGVDYQGTAPDLGAAESGSGGAPPPAPAPTPPPPAPTPTPPPAPTPTPAPQPPTSFSSSATATPATPTPGSTVTLTAEVTSTTSVDAIVYVGVFSSGGAEVFQQIIENQTLAAGQRASYPLSFQAPQTTGTYVVKIGVFSSPDARTLFHWNDSAGSFSVVAPPPPPPTSWATRATATPSTARQGSTVALAAEVTSP
ncbi:MAG: hypothetical protein HY691_15675, partial [Chloroflexi bacterium]|nr:hypothetical protein [Chloroflexota bacterium]